MATDTNNGPKTEPTTEPRRQSDRDTGKPLDQQSREEPNTEGIERDIPDENGEPPSVKRPGGNAEESEPPVENI